ncbi:zinc ABC transporter substrate-binding protein [Halorhodospira halochloris]|nr:zinc ABC transporter substrate-binding protein [Halorhodospira halochloris]MBK1652481.1 ABC transporter substrate-binding protein [Halorhodospira halochloris]MCG5529468.1 zinc ABC transporter substrate-binding protein [Halorhodospira halochloris]MCG5547445.1 zinc ABC transporter substrate-binding protein [Halorhodospira halochloris]
MVKQRRLLWAAKLSLPLLIMLAPLTLGAEQRIKAVASFTILADLVTAVGGDRVEVVSLAPVGAEVHEWELRPRNFRDLERAEVFFYNGYGLEQWIRQVRATVGGDVDLIAVAEKSGYPTKPIRIGELEGEPDPHMWMDPRAVERYIEVIYQTLAELDPDGEELYRDRADEYQAELKELYADLEEKLATIEEERRILITSEAAFPYFAHAYDFRHDGIWGSNAEEEGSPRQMMRVVDLVNEWRPGAIFWESTISDRYVRSVASDTGVAVAGPLYVDSLGEPDGVAGHYLSMMRHNANVIVAALGDGEGGDVGDEVGDD